MEIRHLINGQDFGEPRNWQNLEININWKDTVEGVNINISELTFVGEANKYLQQRIQNGMYGGVGIFEGEPLELILGEPSSPSFVFKGYLDFTDGVTIVGGQETVCALKKVKGGDWLADVADSFSFAYLYDKGIITESDFKKVPYVINYIPDGMQMIMLSMSMYIMTKELIENINAVSDNVAEVIDASTPVIGVSVGLGAGVVTAWDIGNVIMASLKLVARIVYIVAILIAIKELINQIMEQIFPKQKTYLGMTFYDLFKRGCQYLNLNFESNLLNSLRDEVYIPEKLQFAEGNNLKGFPPVTSPIYNFGDFIRMLKTMYNADYRIINNTLYFERVDYFKITGTYEIPDFFNNQELRLDNVRFNTTEIISNYMINFSYDVQDQNTLDNQDGRVYQVITKPNSVNNQDLVTIKNLAEIQIPLSLGVAKSKLTAVEELAKSLAKFVDSLTGVFGGGTNYVNKINNRVGSLNVSSHYTTVGKLVKMQGGNKLALNQRTEISAKKLWEKYHYIESFAEVNGVHNQYIIFENQKVPMKLSDFEMLLNNNIGLTNNGEQYKIDELSYIPYENTAIITYRVNRKYTNNLKVEYVE